MNLDRLGRILCGTFTATYDHTSRVSTLPVPLCFEARRLRKVIRECFLIVHTFVANSARKEMPSPRSFRKAYLSG